MKTVKRYLRGRIKLFLILLCAVFFNHSVKALDCSRFVQLNGGTIEVEADASGGDTDNLQCAIDEAVKSGYGDILLVSNEYFIDRLAAKRFVGTIRGVSKSKTRLSLNDFSLSCDQDMGTGIEFVNGNAALRNMTVEVDSPCANSGTATVVGFYSDSQKCSSRTTFGNLDRVNIVGAGTSGSDYVTGVTMEAASGCSAPNERILGTLKVNRSEMSQLDFGILTSVAGGGQVDINYNSFSEVGLPITILNAQQSTTILANTINYNDVSTYESSTGLGLTGVYIVSNADSPSANATAIKNNKFIDAGASVNGTAISVGQLEKQVAHKLFVSANTFTGNEKSYAGAGLLAIDTRDGVVSSNLFVSASGAWIALTQGKRDEGFVQGDVTGWAIVANNFTSSSADADVDLGTGTSGAVVVGSLGTPCVLSESQTDNYVIDDSDCTNDSAVASQVMQLKRSPIMADEQSSFTAALEILLERHGGK